MQARSGMSRSANVVEPGNRGSMAGKSRQRTHEEKLIGFARPAVGIATDQIDVAGLQIGRRQDDSFERRAFEIGNLPNQLGDDPVGVTFT